MVLVTHDPLVYLTYVAAIIIFLVAVSLAVVITPKTVFWFRWRFTPPPTSVTAGEYIKLRDGRDATVRIATANANGEFMIDIPSGMFTIVDAVPLSEMRRF